MTHTRQIIIITTRGQREEEEKGLNCSISYGIFIKSSINFVKLCLKHKMLGFYGVLESIVVAKFNN